MLSGVGLVVLAAVVEAVMLVSRKPIWATAQHHLTLIDSTDRRTNPLPVVGTDRRNKPTDSELARDAA
jgi:hypothetical protein